MTAQTTVCEERGVRCGGNNLRCTTCAQAQADDSGPQQRELPNKLPCCCRAEIGDTGMSCAAARGALARMPEVPGPAGGHGQHAGLCATTGRTFSTANCAAAWMVSSLSGLSCCLNPPGTGSDNGGERVDVTKHALLQRKSGRAHGECRDAPTLNQSSIISDQISRVKQRSAMPHALMFTRRGPLGPSLPASGRSHCVLCNRQKGACTCASTGDEACLLMISVPGGAAGRYCLLQSSPWTGNSRHLGRRAIQEGQSAIAHLAGPSRSYRPVWRALLQAK